MVAPESDVLNGFAGKDGLDQSPSDVDLNHQSRAMNRFHRRPLIIVLRTR